ncbi:hypothetical protein F4821DRAFT_63773 [Hypoxylon rubiginosum]|uniref:Uncharacterized protein n=1 Tax=Hypoxylon rubiginosum TaxID=110542 RepID=A0ACC0CIY6_9PEZI|nr:hypothetical protein F4821DRAFT_63773 [Hypoxylon rubiginosum]
MGLNPSLQRRDTFDDVPHLKARPHPNPLGSHPPLTKEGMLHRQKLRAEWPCPEPMPPNFDPSLLKAIKNTFADSELQNKLVKQYTEASRAETARGEVGRHAKRSHGLDTRRRLEDEDDDDDDDLYENAHLFMQTPNSSGKSVSDAVSITDSLKSDELDGYESEVTIGTASRASIKRVSLHSMSGTSRTSTAATAPATALVPTPIPALTRNFHGLSIRIPTETRVPSLPLDSPRIGSGSRPPLSRSALASFGSPCPRGSYRGRSHTVTLSGYPRAEGYFPYESMSDVADMGVQMSGENACV